MFEKPKIKARPTKPGTPNNPSSSEDWGRIPLYGCAVLAVLVVVLAITTFNYASKFEKTLNVAGALNKKVKELELPKYDEQYDFLTSQCNQGAYCVSVDTNNPSLEIYKFLVNFREIPNYNYRLFLEVSVGKTNIAEPFKFSCDAQDSRFYICQEISASSPTDVMRVFALSYKTLSQNANYSFNLMIKPISQNEDPLPVKMTPNPNLVVKPIQESSDTASSSEAMPAEEMKVEGKPVEGAESAQNQVVDSIPGKTNESIADKLVSN